MYHPLVCKNPSCPAFQPVASMTSDEVLHCECGSVLEMEVFPIAVVFTGPIEARHLDPNLEKKTPGHWVYGKDPVTGQQVSRRVETWDDQRRVCKEFGYANPKEQPRNLEVHEDGKRLKNTVGMPGCEV